MILLAFILSASSAFARSKIEITEGAGNITPMDNVVQIKVLENKEIAVTIKAVYGEENETKPVSFIPATQKLVTIPRTTDGDEIVDVILVFDKAMWDGGSQAVEAMGSILSARVPVQFSATVSGVGQQDIGYDNKETGWHGSHPVLGCSNEDVKDIAVRIDEDGTAVVNFNEIDIRCQ